MVIQFLERWYPYLLVAGVVIACTVGIVLAVVL
jgi:hypothetical protein